MSDTLLLTFRIGLLVLLWIFILLSLNILRKDTNRVAAVPRSSKKIREHRKYSQKNGNNGLTLEIIDGPMTGSHMNISSLEEITIGRSSDCTFIVRDEYASGRHAYLFRRGAEWFIEDLESRNGTYLENHRIDQPEKITPGSTIKIGSTSLQLTL